ncbi:predicted protein [Scheffersomyces stipitis CBS 6054]|uniref:Uncharacterized protein n=1 Tax=Scheffersomyces stipitis (strain ATCC 58785 / CBS 6054 / NBRC 10063 / NRRL Y-11545) TaxID=322104 RepID=A3LT19_PICST|nr:predicted protein [Scheffersomyces stipitis CBS 6054]ABN66335.2 predicted protein [Scheffersomyces stipitis CBS 6054]KAG2733323.1 hypothetical protein G9P44_004313 [Scheffersomyces stipitis]
MTGPNASFNDTVFEDAVDYSFSYTSKYPTGSQVGINDITIYDTPLRKLPNNSISNSQFTHSISQGALYRDLGGVGHESSSTVPYQSAKGSESSSISRFPINFRRYDDVNISNDISYDVDSLSGSSGNLPVNSSNYAVDSTSLRDASFRIHQTKLMLSKEKEVQSEVKSLGNNGSPLYYRPSTSNIKDNQYGIRSFLPPNVILGSTDKTEQSAKNRNKVPLFVNRPPPNGTNLQGQNSVDVRQVYKQIKTQYEDDELDDNSSDPAVLNPQGEWMNPFMRQALSRQINKEDEIKKCLKNVIYLISFALLKSSVNKLLVLYELKKRSSITYQLQLQYQKHTPSDVLDIMDNLYVVIFGRLIIGLFVLNIIVSLMRIVQGSDPCKDLPLSDKQRELIGVEREKNNLQDTRSQLLGGVDDPEDRKDEDAELILKQRKYQLNNNTDQIQKMPKYNKLSGYTSYNLNSNIDSNAVATVTSSQSLYSVRNAASAAVGTGRYVSNTSNAGYISGTGNSLGLVGSQPSSSQFLTNNKVPSSRLSMSLNRASKLDEEKMKEEAYKFHRNFDIDFNYDT